MVVVGRGASLLANSAGDGRDNKAGLGREKKLGGYRQSPGRFEEGSTCQRHTVILHTLKANAVRLAAMLTW